MALKLSVLDQSLARGADMGPVAFQETLQMAQWCEELGYERFWVSEHHAFPSVAGSAPEVLLAALDALPPMNGSTYCGAASGFLISKSMMARPSMELASPRAA